MPNEPCCIANQFCTAPAGIKVGGGIADLSGISKADYVCGWCDEPVCKECSQLRKIRVLKGKGKKVKFVRELRRVCDNCAEELDGNYDRVQAKYDRKIRKENARWK